MGRDSGLTSWQAAQAEERRRLCRKLQCPHRRCAHGRPHCPVCPNVDTPRRTPPACAACSGAPAEPETDLCERCAEHGIAADRLFEVA